MAEYYGYFNGVEYDEQFVALVNSILVQNGVFGNGLIVSAGSGMTVNAAQGAAIVDGFIYYNDSSMPLTISTANASLPRIDSIMLRWNIPNRTMNLTVVTGTAQSNPSAPAPVRDGTYYDMQIATVYVGAGVASITAANITDTRPNSEVCGITSGYNSVDIDAMMAQYTAQFNDWFDQMKGQLTTDAAGNLQSQIDEINPKVEQNEQNIQQLQSDTSQNESEITSIQNVINQSGQTNGSIPYWNGSEFTAGAPLTSITQQNLLINSDFAINQRGQSSYSTVNQYTYDRWFLASAKSVTRQTNTCPDCSAQYMLNISVKNNSANSFCQPMENFSDRFVGKTVTVSFYVKAATSGSLICGFGNNRHTFQATTSWQKVMFTIPSVSAYSSEWHLNGFYMQTPFGETSGAIGNYSITGVQVVYGDYAGQYIPPDPSIELPRCQRFYQTNDNDTSQRVLIPVNASGFAYGFVPFPVTMRTIPSVNYIGISDTTGLAAAANGIDVNKGGLTANQTLGIRYAASAEL